MLIYIIMALDLPPWALKAIDKIRRGFLWKGRRDARGGHCLLAWPKVARPRNLGGLGISNLQNLGYALKLIWLWLHKTEPNKAWAFFPIQAQAQVQAFFNMAVKTVVGNGKNTHFWKDRWLLDQSLEQALPHLFSCITVRARKRSVFDAIIGGRWISDIKGALTTCIFGNFFLLWYCNLMWKIHIFGNSQLLARIPLNQPMKPCLLGPPILSLGKRSGRVGLQGSANSSCGPQLTIDVGQLTD